MKLTRTQLALFTVAATAIGGNAAWAASSVYSPLGVAQLNNGVPNFSKADTAKVSGGLLALGQEFQAYSERPASFGTAATEFKSRDTQASIAADSVVIDTAAAGDVDALADDLRALGAQDVSVFGRMVSCRFPLNAITQLKDLSSLQLARVSTMHTHVGAVTSQGDVALRANLARTTFSVDGTGVKVGTLSDSYNCLGTAAAGVTSGDLPAGVTLLLDGACPGGSDEGRAMMEIIHDVAPGSPLSFRTAGGGEASFAAGIIALANDGAKVINDDISYGSEPFYQDGVIAQAINTVKSMGVAYFTSSGNGARKAYESTFRASGQFVNLGFGPEEAHDFDAGAGVDICQQITIPVGKSVALSFQWDQPFFSVSGAPGSASDMDIILTNAACNTAARLATAANSNVGSDPLEILSYTNPGPATTFGVVILHSAGPNPGLMKTIDTAETVVFDEFDTKSGASYGHPLARGGLGVAAADYAETPAFGVTPPLVEGSSSAGGGAILFTTTGVRLAAPEQRLQPAITAPDGGDTSFFGGSDPDNTGFPNFYGTSAAAPHAAGVAALMRQLKPALSPDSIYGALKASAIDMDDPSTAGFDAGFDYSTGAGLIQADAALTRVVDIIFANGFE